MSSRKQTLCSRPDRTLQVQVGPESPSRTASPHSLASVLSFDTGEPSGQTVFKRIQTTQQPPVCLVAPSPQSKRRDGLAGPVVGKGCEEHPISLSCKGVSTDQVLGVLHINLEFRTLVLHLGCILGSSKEH